MKINELKEMTVEELGTQRRDLKQEMINLRVQQQSGQLENPARIRAVRRTIARIETILSSRRNEAATSVVAAAEAETA